MDTYKARVAAKALEAGAYLINDISALRMDPEMVAVVRDADCPVVLMHMLGEPKTMQAAPVYKDVVSEVYAFFAERIAWAVENGIKVENLLIDPGLGFGKTTEHNLALMRGLATFRSLWRAPELKMAFVMPLVMGVMLGSMRFTRSRGSTEPRRIRCGGRSEKSGLLKSRTGRRGSPRAPPDAA